MKNYIERLNAIIKVMSSNNCDIHDLTPLYDDFLNRQKWCKKFNFVYCERIRPYLKKYKEKRTKKGNFERKLFSKAIFNNLYGIRQYKDDLIPYNTPKDSETYLFYASHQYIRRELEHLTIDEIIFLSWCLAKTYR